MQWMSIRPIRAARAFSKAGFRSPGAGQVVLLETVPAPTAVAAALRCSKHLSGRSAVAHGVLRSLSSRAAVINPRNEAGATADAPLRSPVAGGGGCGSAVTGAPIMLAKQEQKAIDELADMSIVDEDDDDGLMGWTNPETGEVGGPKGSLRGAEPTRFGDWEQNGRVSDF